MENKFEKYGVVAWMILGVVVLAVFALYLTGCSPRYRGTLQPSFNKRKYIECQREWRPGCDDYLGRGAM